MCDEKKITLGLLVGGILDDYTVSVCRGVVRKANSMGMQTVVFPGKYIKRNLSNNPELMYEYQFNTIFSYAKKTNVDALICAIGSIGCFASEGEMQEMLEQYRGIPLIILGTRMEGYISVTYDNAQGIYEGLKYLIDNKRCEKIGIVSAKLDDTEVWERERAFKEYLNERGIPFSEKMLVRGDSSRRSTAAYKQLLDANADLDAVFCINDDTALGLYEELRRRNMVPGKDIYVMGFDDTLAAAKAYPSLSTIHADAAILGKEAVEMMADLLAGKEVQSRAVPTRFVRRNSFGSIDNDESLCGDILSQTDLDNIFYRSDGSEYEENAKERAKKNFNNLISALVSEYDDAGRENDKEVQFCMNTFLNDLALVKIIDTNRLIFFLERLCQNLMEKQRNVERKVELRNLFAYIYSRLFCAMDYEIGGMRSKEEEMNYSLKLFVRDMLQFEKGNDQSYGMLLENLSWLKIQNASIAIFQQPVMHLYEEEFRAPIRMKRKAILEDERVSLVSAIDQDILIDDLFDYLKEKNTANNAHVLFPLFYNETLYGVLLCDMTEALFTNGEFFVNQVSSAIRMIQLLHSNEVTQEKLEESLRILKENNLVLDNLSKLDSLTGLLNRRGFFQEAEEMWQDSCEDGSAMYAMYVDMNSLKIINDKYGHKEGDYSLKAIGHVLQEFTKDQGIAGRIGGDEYACIIRQSTEYPNEESVCSEVYRRFEEYNAATQKEFNVTVSVGTYCMDSTTSITLQQAFALADEKLYVEKQRRKKHVLETLQKK